jgi:class 3 adenylate cyclase
VVVSQRLQSIASGGEVIISESVYRSVHGMFSVEPGEPVQVKGLSDPVRPYRVSALPVPGTAVADLAGS